MSGEGDARVDLISELKTSHDTQLSLPPSLLIFSCLGRPWPPHCQGTSGSSGITSSPDRAEKKEILSFGGLFFLSKYKMLLRAFPTNLLNKIESQIHIEIFGICEKRCDHCDPQLIPSAALIPLMVYPQDSGVITRTSSGGHYSTHT